MARVLVECDYTEPLTDDRLAFLLKKLGPCLQIRNGTWRRSALSLDRLCLICEFEAPDAEAVREALRNSGVAYKRVWSVTVFAIEDDEKHLEKLNALVGESPNLGKD